jgi:membrane protein DedA with SNARE-associated domain/rhodanese-related sulfurtransferase
MSDLTAVQSFWILAANTLLHELGVPVPVMPTAFVLGARGVRGASDLLLLIAAIAAGMLIGNSVWFAAGRRYGSSVLKFLCRFSLTADTCVSRTEKLFGRWGWSSLVVGRFVAGVSLVAPPLAGALGMTWGKFLALTAAGAALYGLVILGAGILLRNQIEWALREMHDLGWQALAAAAIALAMYIAWRWWRRRVARAPNVSRISVDELQALIAAGERPLVVDVRGATTQQLDPRRIPDAITISLEAIEANRDELPRDRKIILYCGCPNEASAARAARLLLDRGYPWVRPLAGGLEAWSTAS